MSEKKGIRRFSGERLYKLLRVIVIILTIMAILLASYLHNLYYGSDHFYANGTAQCYKLWPDWNTNDIAGKAFANCFSTVQSLQIGGQYAFDYTVCVAILLPLLFFGGTWLYKYLFPVKKPQIKR